MEAPGGGDNSFPACSRRSSSQPSGVDGVGCQAEINGGKKGTCGGWDNL